MGHFILSDHKDIKDLQNYNLVNMKPKVFVTRHRGSFPSEVMERLEQSCEVSFWKDDSVIPKEELSGKD